MMVSHEDHVLGRDRCLRTTFSCAVLSLSLSQWPFVWGRSVFKSLAMAICLGSFFTARNLSGGMELTGSRTYWGDHITGISRTFWGSLGLASRGVKYLGPKRPGGAAGPGHVRGRLRVCSDPCHKDLGFSSGGRTRVSTTDPVRS